MATLSRQAHRFRMDELNALMKGDQTNQPNGGPIYFSTATHPEFGYLSNDYKSHFCLMGSDGEPLPHCDFRTADQYFHWIKAVAFGDNALADKIALEIDDLAQCWVYGRQVAGFDQRRWDEEKLGRMEGGLFAKFWSPLILSPEDEDLLGKLLNTGQRELVYAVEDDSVWGIGYRPGDAEKNRGRWGQNLLGKALMGARATALLHKQLGVCRGKLLVSKEEHLYRTALNMGKLKWDKDENLEVVKDKCAKGKELQAITRMAEVARNGPETCSAKDIVRRMRESRAHGTDCGCDNT